MIFEIKNATGDWVDVSGFVEEGGISWKRNDVDGPKAGRNTMDMEMTRDRRAIKYEMSVSCRPLKQAESELILALIEPEFIKVKTTSPRHGLGEYTMYSNNVPATHYTEDEYGDDVWEGIQFPLIQK